MSARNTPTWITVLDGAQARFFVLRKTEEGQVFEEIGTSVAAMHQARALRSNRPGRVFASAGGGIRHAVEPHTDYDKLDTANFARKIAGTLDAAFADRRYDQLVLVAPSRNLAELRAHLTPRVRSRVVHEVPKNLTRHTTDALWQKLSGHLLKAAKPLNGSTSRVTPGADFPVAIVFRNMDPSPTVQGAALKYAAKMGRKFGRIVSCRVTVEAPHHAHRKVKLFSVSVDLKLPGRDVAAKRASAPRRTYEDVNAALRDAFATATRQMQEHVERIHGEALRTKRRSSERQRRLIAV